MAVRDHKRSADQTVYIGSLFFQQYYFFLSIEESDDEPQLLVGAGKVNPYSIIAEQHYDPRSTSTNYSPQSQLLDRSNDFSGFDPYRTKEYNKACLNNNFKGCINSKNSTSDKTYFVKSTWVLLFVVLFCSIAVICASIGIKKWRINKQRQGITFASCK